MHIGIPAEMQITIYATIVSCVIVLLLGIIVIPALKTFKFGQSIREEGPKSHLKKSGIPTMGGIMFIISTAITVIIVSPKMTGAAIDAVITTVGFGLIGFVDDILKIKRKKNLGLKAYQKLIGQIAFAFILVYFAYTNGNIGSGIHIPYTNIMFDLGIWYIPFMIFVVVAIVNGVNLTDGLDGLASSVTIIVGVFFVIVTYGLHMTDLSIFCGALVGGLLGFLKYNSYPAQVFMGDTGSLALGGAISAMAVLLKMPFIIVIVGIIYVVENLSVVLQVGYFKLTGGKRLFKMAPLHHHFELKGWHETKVVAVFSIITAIFCLLGLLAISF
jgi:phospho-N-acetylmuramoyl-pentapeptide-transferase